MEFLTACIKRSSIPIKVKWLWMDVTHLSSGPCLTPSTHTEIVILFPPGTRLTASTTIFCRASTTFCCTLVISSNFLLNMMATKPSELELVGIRLYPTAWKSYSELSSGEWKLLYKFCQFCKIIRYEFPSKSVINGQISCTQAYNWQALPLIHWLQAFIRDNNSMSHKEWGLRRQEMVISAGESGNCMDSQKSL